MSKKKVLVIVGPTGVGKTALSIRLAKWLNTEIISGDSIQIYRGLDVGSAKVTKEEMDGVVHHLIDIKDPTDGYSVAEFQTLAREKIQQISEHSIPIIAGGTGLYIKSVIYDYVFHEEEVDEEYLKELDQYSNEELWKMLEEIDPKACESLHQNNRKRVKRALMIAHLGEKKSFRIDQQEHQPIYDAFVIGCTMERNRLYARINRRVEMMMEDGLKEEVTKLQKEIPDFFHQQCAQGIGYREWADYFPGNITEEEVVENIQKHSRQFAKRQYTWFRNQMDVHWYDMNEYKEEDIKEELKEWMKEEMA